MPVAASQYPATAMPAGGRMTGPMIAMGCLPPTGDGLSSAGLGEEPGGIRRWHAGLAAPWPGPESGEGGHGGGQQAGGTRAGGEVVAVNERPAGAVTRRAQGACAAARPGTPVGRTGCLQRASRTGAGPGCLRVTRPTGPGRAGPASVSTGGVPAWV